MKNPVKKFASDLRIRIGYAIAFFLLLVSYLLTLYANHGYLDESNMVNHTHRVMINTERLLSSLKDAESAFRGYIVVKDSSFLLPYNKSRQLTDSFYNSLKNETSDNISQQQRLETLHQLILKKYQIFDASLIHYATHNFEINDSLKLQAYFSHTIMMRVSSLGREIEKEEERLLQVRKNLVEKQYNIMNNIIMASLLLAFFLVVYGFFTYAKENRARRESDKKVDIYQKQLRQRITELDETNKVLEKMRSIEKFAVTGRIARTIAHEVRNPLTNINLAADQMKSDPNGAGDSGKMLELIHRNSDRINQLITDLLDSTKAAELRLETLPINVLLDETLALARDRIELSGIQVTKDYSVDDVKVKVDREKMKIAFLNIVVNAIESMDAVRGQLIVVTVGEQNKCIVKISDNGHGIDKDSLSKLFEPYFTSKQGGTGLGLTNTQNIIFTHNGQISAESEIGFGTTFTVILDRA